MSAIHDVPSRSLYEAVDDSNINSETLIATVIRGADAGEKAVISDGNIKWLSAADGFIKAHSNEVTDIHGSGIFELDGQEVFVELLGNEKHMVICGAGHLSLPLITILRMLGMFVTVIDDREEFAENARQKGANRVICKPFKEGMAEIEGNDDTYFVIVTRGHHYDRDCVGAALLKKHAYVGMIGSRRHAVIVKGSLLQQGIPEELIESIYTPIGIDIDAETPEEIAVAIAGEIIHVKNHYRRNFAFSKEMMKAILTQEREPMILATIIKKAGSAPRAVGTKMLVKKDGSIIGTIGGGSAEGEIIAHAAEMLNTARTESEILQFNLISGPQDAGMVCGGIMDVLFETI